MGYGGREVHQISTTWRHPMKCRLAVRKDRPGRISWIIFQGFVAGLLLLAAPAHAYAGAGELLAHASWPTSGLAEPMSAETRLSPQRAEVRNFLLHQFLQKLRNQCSRSSTIGEVFAGSGTALLVSKPQHALRSQVNKRFCELDVAGRRPPVAPPVVTMLVGRGNPQGERRKRPA